MTIDVDSLLRKAVENGRMHGVAAAATKDGKIIYQGAFGKREVNSQSAPEMTLDTPVRLYSMTKALTICSVMKLVEQGKLALDQEARTILPELAVIQVLKGFDANDEPILAPLTKPITIRHLATHTSGLVYDTWNADFKKYLQKTGKPRGTHSKEVLRAAVLAREPGERWEYGIGIDFLGWIVQEVSGQTLEDFMQEHILKPLGMSQTSFYISPANQSRRLQVAQRREDGSLIPTPIAEFIPPAGTTDMLPGGSGMFSSCADYLKLVTALANGGAPILSSESTKVLLSNQLGDLAVQTLPAALPISNAAVPRPGEKWSVLGQVNVVDVPGARRAGSNSWSGLANTYYWIDPASRVAGVLCTQMFPFSDAQVLQTFDEFERAIYATL
ncbi:beta-lactamase [Gonapodya prolifera JEL478]|uniref:Beta-lactamase n=1 Tax=Gonapodya prolifera (strain JEL478) TaxID=1344416 RepID=A0A139AS50_GONPJ|nr:beta-lactamase [Gonapodya prolifera JEL478]|eukprot:KXS19567.1 beta-lactamase [Gonapodya prolifera JEL478]